MNIRKYIPSFITCCNLACGFAVFLADPKYGIWLIFAGAIFDVFDGFAARMLQAQSEFGKELDSLADMVTFGAAPAFLIAQLLPAPWYYCSILIVVAAALRLAKFNISGGDSYYFKGLATPSSALFYIGILISQEWFIGERTFFILPLILLISLLNVSNLKMFSFKGIGKDKWTLPFLIATGVLAIILLAINFKIAVVVTMLFYILLSIVYTFSISKATTTLS